MNTVDVMDAAKRALGIQSDYALAKTLRVSRNVVSNWRTGQNTPDTMSCYRLAELAHLDPALVVASIERERAERRGKPEEVSGWGALIERLGGVAAAVMVSAGLYVGAGDAQASGPALRVADAPQSVYYVNRLLRLLRELFCEATSPRHMVAAF